MIGASMRRALAILALGTLASCRTASGPPPDPNAALPTELGKPASSLPATAIPTVATKPGTNATETASARSTSTPGARTYRVAASRTDAASDSSGPAYTDVARVVIESDGARARISVTMHAAIRDPMPSGEQMAIGVDLYRTTSQAESDYQVYASGTPDGWVAFLDTPSGFVRYPGEFGIGGSTFVFTVPWSALGGITRGSAAAFMDWDRKGIVLNETAHDRLPDEGRFSYR
jgi:hypothetical protein